MNWINTTVTTWFFFYESASWNWWFVLHACLSEIMRHWLAWDSTGVPRIIFLKKVFLSQCFNVVHKCTAQCLGKQAIALVKQAAQHESDSHFKHSNVRLAMSMLCRYLRQYKSRLTEKQVSDQQQWLPGLPAWPDSFTCVPAEFPFLFLWLSGLHSDALVGQFLHTERYVP